MQDFKGVELFAVKRFNLDKERRAHVSSLVCMYIWSIARSNLYMYVYVHIYVCMRVKERHQKKERRHISRPSSSAASSPLVSPDRKKKIGPGMVSLYVCMYVCMHSSMYVTRFRTLEARVAGSRTPSASLSARYREHPSSSKERTDEPKKTNNRYWV